MPLLTRRAVDPAGSVISGDCISGMAAMPASCVDLVVTDPPFAIRFKAGRSNYNRKAGNVLPGYMDVEREDYAAFSRAWIGAAHRVLKDSGSMFVFSGWTHLKDVLAALDGAGFETVNHIVWKYQFGVATEKKFVTSHYHCMYVCKDGSKRRFYADSRFGPGRERYADMEDVWAIKREYWRGEKKTPTKLPSELVRKILQYASRRGDFDGSVHGLGAGGRGVEGDGQAVLRVRGGRGICRLCPSPAGARGTRARDS